MTTAPNLEHISHLFVSFYYQTLHKTPTELSKLYTKNAKLTHTIIPQGAEQLRIKNKFTKISKCTSFEEIRDFYLNTNVGNSKIRISSIDYQEVLVNSILITTTGELALSEKTPVYSFTQTFILTPNQKNANYDVVNDIFRLIPDDDLDLEGAVEEATDENIEGERNVEVEDTQSEEIEKSKKETATEDGKFSAIEVVDSEGTESGVTKEGETKAQVKQEEELTIETEDETKTANAAETEIQENLEIKEETLQTPTEHENEEAKATSDLTKENQPSEVNAEGTAKNLQTSESPSIEPVKQSWAAIAKSTTPNTISPQSTSSSSSTPKAKVVRSPNPESSKEIVKSRSKTSSKSSTQLNANNGQRIHKAELQYAIIVNKINNLKADQIKDAIEKEFGKTTKVEPKGRYGLVAFETEESQKKALASKTINIDSNIITISPKTNDQHFNNASSKKGTSSTGNSSNTNNRAKQGSSGQNSRKKATSNGKQ
ncbi:hypothetical protein WICMUC_005345 [Wickerhamomyces mucosus]|uniref:NTF2 domain-containing protein n=1 Tax=Wickerhamomyces mucosus TaxID=1378264 RepID=A0A9P8P722_9ASCO|nr:hypothetical protein WICMUC_005345 [Wickerhamomyces mucosus]